MRRHLLTVEAQPGPVVQARLFTVLRSRRVPFAIGFATSDGGEAACMTLFVDCEADVAERIVLHLRRVVGVRTVVRHRGEAAMRDALARCVARLDAHLTESTNDPALPEELA